MDLLRLALVAVLLLLLSGITHSQAGADPGYQLDILHMDETGLVLELRLTGFALADRHHRGETFQTVTVPGLTAMTAPGQPQVPALARLLGTPPGGIAEIEILAAQSETLDSIRLLPTPKPLHPTTDEAPVETLVLDQALYATDAAFPGPLAEVGLTGYLRHQPVAQVRLYPFQYNPLRQQLEVYRRLRVQVRFAPATDLQADPPIPRPDTPYEHLLEDLLPNYATLPPVPPSQMRTERTEAAAAHQSPALKVFVEQDGLYRITHSDLQNAGFSLEGIDPRNLHLWHGESEVGMAVGGQEDGVFDPDDWLEFYGTAVVSEFTSRNVYWLTVGDGPGLRMAERDGTPTGTGSTPTAFYALLRREKDYVYWSQLPPAAGPDHWFWERFPSAPHSREFWFDVSHRADIPAEGLVRVALVGRTSTSQNPDHHTRILLNGHPIHDAWWDGQIAFTHHITISQQDLRDGYNALTVETPGDTEATVDSIYVNWFEVGYWDTFVARDDLLRFDAPETGRTVFTLTNFNSDEIDVYDISDPLQVTRLTNGLVESDGGKYRLQIEDDVSPGARYLALTDAQKRSPAGLLLDTPSNWRSPDNGADYIIITHEKFSNAAAQLASHRTAQGFRVATADITDVYDEFSDGVFDPQAVRDFLSYAYHHWTPPAPLYVLLIGDANYDYKGHLDTGSPNYVPTHLFESSLIGQTSTDNWFVSVSGDDPLPDMFIGRLPAQTPSQANLMVAKILTYERNLTPEDWLKQALFVADDDSDDVFETVSDELIATLPDSYSAQAMHSTVYPHAYDPTSDIITAINHGTSVVNYVGHGTVTGLGYWPGGKAIFEREDIAELNNGARYPFLAIGNCHSGLFAYPYGEAFAEEFIQHQNGGGIAAFGPTGLGYTSWHDAVLGTLYQTIFDDYTYQLGPATTTARIAALTQTGWTEPVKIFSLLGDPALALRVVQPRLSLSQAATPAYVHPGQLLSYTLAYANEGNELAENAVLSETYDAQTVYHTAHPEPTEGNNVWQLGSLAAGARGTITVTVRVPEMVLPGTTLLNQAVLSGNGLAPQSSTAHTLVVQPGLSLEKTTGASQVRRGQLLTYTLTYANVGNTPVENAVLTETYDAHTTFYSASPPPNQGDNMWQLGSLPVGTQGTITVVVRVRDTAPIGAELVNNATLQGDGVGPELAAARTAIEPILVYLPIIRK